MVLRPDLRPPTLGWREWIALPGLGVPMLKAKVDTGARSSALHAFELEIVRRTGIRWLRFTIHPWQGDVTAAFRATCEQVAERRVRTSAGHTEVRPVVITDVVVGGCTYPIEVTLTNRDSMGFRMLLGRSAVRGRFLVDPGISFVQGHPRSGVAGPAASPDGPAPVVVPPRRSAKAQRARA